jgi:FkbM family methyltransferase
MSGVFHRIWFGTQPVPGSYEEYWQAWQRQFPDATFTTWRDEDIERLPLCRGKLLEFSSHISRADVARYEILYTYGGIYLDCDILPHQHFSVEEMTQTLTVCNETASLDYCSIGFIGAPPGHPVFLELIEYIKATDIDEAQPNKTTGPWLFGEFIKRHAHRRLPTEAFYPYLYDEPLSIVRKRSLGNTLGIHVWGGAWLPASLKKEKAMQLLGKGDIAEPYGIIASYADEWSNDIKVLLETIRDVRVKSVDAALVLNKSLSVAPADHVVFDFTNVVSWLLADNPERMVWQVGAADGTLVDPLRPAMINFDPPAMLLEPNPYLFAMLQQGYRNNANALLLPVAYGIEAGELVLNAINPDKVEQAGLPRWVLGISSVYDDKNALGGKTIDEATTQRIQTCVEQITVPALNFEQLLDQAQGRLPDILVVDAEGMDKAIIDDVLQHDHLPMVIHFEVQCLEPTEQQQLLASIASEYVVLQFGNDMTAYRNDVILEYAKAMYVLHGIPTFLRQGLLRLNGL